jgi:hypothetical protein
VSPRHFRADTARLRGKHNLIERLFIRQRHNTRLFMGFFMRRQFTLFRLMAAVTTFSLIFGLTSLLWKLDSIVAVGISFIVSLCWLLIVLIADKRDFARVIVSVTCSGFGGLLGFMFTNPIRPPYEPGNEFYNAILGVIAGWVIAGFVIRRDEKYARNFNQKMMGDNRKEPEA